MTEQYFTVIPALILILMLIVGLALLVRRFAPALTRSSARLQVLSSMSLGGKERVVLLQAGDDYLLLGVGPGHVVTLHKMDREQALVGGLTEGVQTAGAGFAGILQQLRKSAGSAGQ